MDGFCFVRRDIIRVLCIPVQCPLAELLYRPGGRRTEEAQVRGTGGLKKLKSWGQED